MNYWLVKSEPETFSWDDFVNKGGDHWDGVRNYQARNNLKAMKKGDMVLFYHSVKEKSVVGIAVVAKEFYPDPTATEGDWVVVDLKPEQKLKKPVTLEQIKKDSRLSHISLIKQSRLSVMPLKKEEFDIIISKSED
jgi:predicted RNA-binding protein with PUA-like domain